MSQPARSGGFLIPRDLVDIIVARVNREAVRELGKKIWTTKARVLAFPVMTAEGMLQGTVTDLRHDPGAKEEP